MELRVGGNEVFLCFSRAYVAEDDAALLQQISKFKPLVDYLTTFKPQDLTVSTITVTNVTMIASRVFSIIFDLTLVHSKSRESCTQTVKLEDSVQCVVLPILSVGTSHYAALVARPRVALGGEFILEAFSGAFGKDGLLTAPSIGLLECVGLQVSEKTTVALSNEEICLGDELGPVRILKATKAISQQTFDDAFASAQPDELGARLVAIPLEEVITNHTSDMKAVVAATLALNGAQ